MRRCIIIGMVAAIGMAATQFPKTEEIFAYYRMRPKTQRPPRPEPPLPQEQGSEPPVARA